MEIPFISPVSVPLLTRPQFVDRYNIVTAKTERLFQSDKNFFEMPEAILDDAGKQILTRRESPTEYPNYYIRSGGELRQLTHFKDPVPQVQAIQKKLVTYKRADGVPLSFTLYLPANYKAREPSYRHLSGPILTSSTMPIQPGRVTGSAQRFTALSTHLLLVLRGYAVLENAGMPVIGNPETVNNTYLDQIVMDAKAAIDKAVDLGVTDRAKIAVGGHSYGGFMTANLLAHSDLFHAGIAKSGAYNRTLTPFGFQSERRTMGSPGYIYQNVSLYECG